jgi:hypothetical protein
VVSKKEIQTYKASGEFDIRAKIAGTNKDLPFKNIATVDWIDSGKALVVAYDTLKDPTGKNFIYKINPDDKEQGVYIYDINTGSSTNIWNKPKDNLFYQARVGNLGAEKVIILNTTQTLEVVNPKGEKIKTLFYNLDIKDFPKSYLSFEVKQPDQNKISFEVLGITPKSKKFNLDI